jgi:hypothetical protein
MNMTARGSESAIPEGAEQQEDGNCSDDPGCEDEPPRAGGLAPRRRARREPADDSEPGKAGASREVGEREDDRGGPDAPDAEDGETGPNGR